VKKLAQYAGGIACVALAHSPVVAADWGSVATNACAVSEINGKIGAGAGHTKDTGSKGGLFQGTASLSIPLNCSFGFQLDAAVGSLDGKSTGGGAVHAFTRNPNSYLLGAYGEYSAVGSNDILRLGVEAEYYLDKVTLSGLAGYENSDLTKGDAFAALDISFYATDNLRFSAGYRRFLDIDAAAIGAEYQFENAPVSLFVSGQLGSKDHRTAIAGLRVYFGGENKSLIRRHREDDPFNRLNELIRNIATPAPVVVPPPSPGGGEGGGEVT